jgi:hypothetical protein
MNSRIKLLLLLTIFSSTLALNQCDDQQVQTELCSAFNGCYGNNPSRSTECGGQFMASLRSRRTSCNNQYLVGSCANGYQPGTCGESTSTSPTGNNTENANRDLNNDPNGGSTPD